MKVVFAGALAGALASCVPPIDVSHAPCPCDDAHECCPTVARDQCVPKGRLEECRGIEGCLLPDGRPATLAIAAGEPDATTARALDGRGTLQLNYGVQVGFHVYLQLLATRFYPNGVRLTRRLLDPTTQVELRRQVGTADLVCDAGAWVLLQGQLTYVCPANLAGESVLHDRTLTLELTLESDRAPFRLEQSFPIWPVCPNDSHFDLCANRARGCGQGP